MQRAPCTIGATCKPRTGRGRTAGAFAAAHRNAAADENGAVQHAPIPTHTTPRSACIPQSPPCCCRRRQQRPQPVRPVRAAADARARDCNDSGAHRRPLCLPAARHRWSRTPLQYPTAAVAAPTRPPRAGRGASVGSAAGSCGCTARRRAVAAAGSPVGMDGCECQSLAGAAPQDAAELRGGRLARSHLQQLVLHKLPHRTRQTHARTTAPTTAARP